MAFTMNVERGEVNYILVTGRETLSPSNWLCAFEPVAGGTIVYCITQNDGNSTGPLLLPVEDTSSPVAVDGEVELAEGDWILRIYQQTSTTNLDPTGLTVVWSEQVRVD